MDCAAVDRIDHIAILVHSVDGSLPYYVERLGMTLINDERLPEVGVRLAYLNAGTTMIQLVEPTHPGPLGDHLARHGEGLHHVCFAVRDIRSAVARLAPHDRVDIAMGGRGRRAVFLPSGPNGVRMELTEIEPHDGKD